MTTETAESVTTRSITAIPASIATPVETRPFTTTEAQLLLTAASANAVRTGAVVGQVSNASYSERMHVSTTILAEPEMCWSYNGTGNLIRGAYLNPAPVHGRHYATTVGHVLQYVDNEHTGERHHASNPWNIVTHANGSWPIDRDSLSREAVAALDFYEVELTASIEAPRAPGEIRTGDRIVLTQLTAGLPAGFTGTALEMTGGGLSAEDYVIISRPDGGHTEYSAELGWAVRRHSVALADTPDTETSGRPEETETPALNARLARFADLAARAADGAVAADLEPRVGAFYALIHSRTRTVWLASWSGEMFIGTGSFEDEGTAATTRTATGISRSTVEAWVELLPQPVPEQAQDTATLASLLEGDRARWEEFQVALGELAVEHQWCGEYESVCTRLGIEAHRGAETGDWDVFVDISFSATVSAPSSSFDNEVRDEFEGVFESVSLNEARFEGTARVRLNFTDMTEDEARDSVDEEAVRRHLEEEFNSVNVSRWEINSVEEDN